MNASNEKDALEETQYEEMTSMIIGHKAEKQNFEAMFKILLTPKRSTGCVR